MNEYEKYLEQEAFNEIKDNYNKRLRLLNTAFLGLNQLINAYICKDVKSIEEINFNSNLLESVIAEQFKRLILNEDNDE